LSLLGCYKNRSLVPNWGLWSIKITELRKRCIVLESHRKRDGEGMSLANLRLWLTKPNLIILPSSTPSFLAFFLSVSLFSLSLSFFLSRFLLLLLVRQISPFLVTNNGKIYRQFGAEYKATRRLDVVESRFWQLCTAPFVWVTLSFLFIYFLFSRHAWSFRIVDHERTC